jgi:hypothetical protein
MRLRRKSALNSSHHLMPGRSSIRPWRIFQMLLIILTFYRILWLIYLIIVAVAVSKHRKAGGHSHWIPGEQNPRHDNRVPNPLPSTVLPYRREAPPDSYQGNMYQLGSLHINGSSNRLRLDSFGDPVEEERRGVGGEDA